MISDGLIKSETEFLLKNSTVVTVVETYLRCPTNELQTGRTTTKKNRLSTSPCPLSFWHVCRNFHYTCKIIQKTLTDSDVYILVLKKYQKCLKYHSKIFKGGKHHKSLQNLEWSGHLIFLDSYKILVSLHIQCLREVFLISCCSRDKINVPALLEFPSFLICIVL